MADSNKDRARKASSASAAKPKLAPWKKLLALLALALVVGGGVWQLAARRSAPQSSPSSAAGATSLAAPGSSAAAAAEPSRAEEYGPAVMKVGFGFLAGLAIGVFLRTSFKAALFVAGLFALALFGLDHFGLVDVRWDAFDSGFESLRAALGRQFESFTAFVQGELPGGSAALAGLASGLKRG